MMPALDACSVPTVTVGVGLTGVQQRAAGGDIGADGVVTDRNPALIGEHREWLPVTRAPIEWSPVVMTPASFWITRAP